MKTTIAALTVLGGIVFSAIAGDNKPWWVSDEEREFLKRRTTHIDFIPGTPEGNAKRFYYDEAKTKYVEFNYDESKAGEGTYTLEDPLAFADGRKVESAAQWQERRKEILDLFEREVYGRMPPKPDEFVVEMLSEKLTEDRFAVERRYRMWFRKYKTGPVIDWVMFVPKYAKKIIDSNASEEEVTLVKDVLAYIRAAYVYFDAEGKDEALATIDEILGAYSSTFEKVSGETDTEEGLKSVTIVLEAKPVVRFVLPEGKTAENYTFSCGGRTLEYTTGAVTVGEVEHVYVELELYAYQLIGEIEYTDGTYSGSFHINSYYDFVTTDEDYKDNANLITLVEKLYNYARSAESYRASVAGN